MRRPFCTKRRIEQEFTGSCEDGQDDMARPQLGVCVPIELAEPQAGLDRRATARAFQEGGGGSIEGGVVRMRAIQAADEPPDPTRPALR